MKQNGNHTIFDTLKKWFIGEARNPMDQRVFHNISLIAFFAWVGLGADGLSSSCYGPAEAFATLGKHFYLGILIAIATAFTIFIIVESYSQIIELFPSGGGGYIVASKLLSPKLGALSGCALLIDYILTITLSVASGSDALFSMMPQEFHAYKLWFALLILAVLIILNLRGVKESILVLMPIFLGFVATHVGFIIYAFYANFPSIPTLVHSTGSDIKSSVAELGVFGLLFLLMRAYSMGAGTYTGIEAVSNNLNVLREPKVKTGKKTMFYMAVSLTIVVIGLMFAYAFYSIEPQIGKTLNAVLFEQVTVGWGGWGYVLVLLTLISEAAILFVAAQTGFLGGPSILANMAADRWVPKRFALLSDRLVTMNGILIMGIGSMLLMTATNGSVTYLVVLYSINVFITFCLSQLGMVRYWFKVRHEIRNWFGKFIINGVGLMLTTFILLMVTVIKFHEGGWITLFITGSLFVFVYLIKRSYVKSDRVISNLDSIIKDVETSATIPQIPVSSEISKFNPEDKTAVILVKDFTGVGIKTIFNIMKSFGGVFKNFVFIQVGLINASAFKDADEMRKVREKVENEVNRYIELMKKHGYHAEGMGLFGTDTVEEISHVASQILHRYPNATFFGGQVVFPNNPLISRLLHNYTLFSMQQRLFKEGVPLFIIPIDVA